MLLLVMQDLIVGKWPAIISIRHILGVLKESDYGLLGANVGLSPTHLARGLAYSFRLLAGIFLAEEIDRK